MLFCDVVSDDLERRIALRPAGAIMVIGELPVEALA